MGLALALTALAAACAATPALALPGGNLLANPGGEAPPAFSENLLTEPDGWGQRALKEAGVQGPYDSCYGGGSGSEERELLPLEVSNAIGGGARFFYAGEVGLSDLYQEVAVDPAEAFGHQLLIGGEFGGFEGQEDYATLTAQFLDAAGDEVGSELETPLVTAADRGGETELLRREAAGPVPPGTAKIRFILAQVREEGTDNDGYADNLFASFDSTAPAPPTPSGDANCPLSTAPAEEDHETSPPPPAPAPEPSVKITSGPPRESAQTGAVFTFTGAAGGSFECALDGGPFKVCKSGQDFGPVQPGDHRFQVREKLGGRTSAAATYNWTVDLPRQCVLRVARARVFVYAKRDKARLVIHYTSYRAARVTVGYQLAGRKGSLKLGAAGSTFSKAGVFRLPEPLSAAAIGKVRAAKSFQVKFKIAKTPASCGRYYTKRLTIPKRVSGQTVWFQSDSSFAPGG